MICFVLFLSIVPHGTARELEIKSWQSAIRGHININGADDNDDDDDDDDNTVL